MCTTLYGNSWSYRNSVYTKIPAALKAATCCGCFASNVCVVMLCYVMLCYVMLCYSYHQAQPRNARSGVTAHLRERDNQQKYETDQRPWHKLSCKRCDHACLGKGVEYLSRTLESNSGMRWRFRPLRSEARIRGGRLPVCKIIAWQINRPSQRLKAQGKCEDAGNVDRPMLRKPSSLRSGRGGGLARCGSRAIRCVAAYYVIVSCILSHLNSSHLPNTTCLTQGFLKSDE